MDVKTVKLNNPPSPNCILLCFHAVGGNGSIFRRWKDKMLSNNIALYAINLPIRLPTPPLPANVPFGELMDMVCTHIRSNDYGNNNRVPIVLFGHSLGGLVAYEVSKRLGPGVKHLIVSAVKDPIFKSTENSSQDTVFIHKKSDTELFDFFANNGGILEGVDPEFLRATLPVQRRDYELFEKYQYDESTPILALPITTFVASSDDVAITGCAPNWRDFTSGPHTIEGFPGGHFYFTERETTELVADKLIQICMSVQIE